MSLVALLLLLSFSTIARAEDPKIEPGSFLPYIPSLSGNGVIGFSFLVISIISLCYIFYSGPKPETWAMVLPIGVAIVGLGSFLRVFLRTHQKIEFIADAAALMVVVGPSLFLAFNYTIFGRFLTAIEGYENHKDIHQPSKYSPLAASNVKVIFITSDIVTIFIIITGSSLQLKINSELFDPGCHIFLLGTLLQTISYLLFTTLILVAYSRMYRQNNSRFSPFNVEEPCVLLLNLLLISGLGILVRSGYRIAEAIVGFTSYLSTEEKWYMAVDAFPLIISMGVWIIFWPGNILRRIVGMAPAVILQNSRCEVMQPTESLKVICSNDY